MVHLLVRPRGKAAGSGLVPQLLPLQVIENED